MTGISVERQDQIARTAAHGVAIDCLTAGVAAALPEQIVEDRVSLDGESLQISSS